MPSGRLAVGCAGILALTLSASADATPRCFGAAARDSEQPCHNTALRKMVVPSPAAALIEPGAPCAPIRQRDALEVCTSGLPAAKARARVALVGDSHAAHWRAALGVVARREHWHVLSVTRDRCPFSLARGSPRALDGEGCVRWRSAVLSWFGHHPEVHTVFVSDHSGSGVVARPGESQFAAKVAGYAQAWEALPSSVQRVVVIRDVPYNRQSTNRCVERAMAVGRSAGQACGVPRAVALKPDPAVAASDRTATGRTLVVDLTPFMCTDRACFPVVGGALVHKDVGHLTRTFSATLGPYLRRAVGAQVAEPADHPACFGAEARDPERPCENPALRYSVNPSPRTAAITPNSPCTPIERHDLVNVCLFGVSEARATADIALVGDSHASHWRAAVGVAARARRWHGLSVTHTSCPFSDAVKALPAPLRQQCRRWNREVQEWFRQRPEVHVVIVSEHRGDIPVITRSRDKFAAEVAGYVRAWKRLPATVEHILVIRDNPAVPLRTFPCVVRAAARHQRPGAACALLRRRALPRDPAAVAVKRMHSDRVQLVDLTRFFCDATLCFPVVGGALVYKDESHLTRVYARTLGPFLLRRLDALMASWAKPAWVRCPAGTCG